MPDAVLGLFAAGIGFPAMTMAETGIQPQRDLSWLPSGKLTQLVDHVGRTAIHVQPVLVDELERRAIEDIGRVNNRRRIAILGISSCERSLDLTGADGVDQDTVSSHEVENGQIGTRLLGETNHVKGPQIVDSLDDLGRVVDVGRRTELTSKLYHRDSGDLGPECGK